MNVPEQIKLLLEEKTALYNHRDFIENDPVSIPHLFSRKEDIEISGLLAATIAWGNRKSIIQNARRLVQLMDDAPFDFVMNHQSKDLKRFDSFCHRTFNAEDTRFFVRSLTRIYKKDGGLENVFNYQGRAETFGLKNNILQFRKHFLKTSHDKRSEKHVSDPSKKSSSKRLCMFLRWMVRNDRKGVDFGIWKAISPAELCLPLDVHTGNVARKLGLLQRQSNDWQAVEEITGLLRTLDPLDPVKYDFALFGLGVNQVL